MAVRDKAHFRGFCVCVCIGMSMLLVSVSPHAEGQDKGSESFKPVILVPPFENQSKQKEYTTYELKDAKPFVRTFKVDRYTEAPRTYLENILANIPGVTIIERQRVDTLLAETQFGQLSGLVDPDKAIKLGKLVGANLIVVGTIADVSEETKSFKGYGISTNNTAVSCEMRVRLLDIESGKVLYSTIVKGSKTYEKTNFGGTKSSDRNFAAVKAAVEKLSSDPAFRTAMLKQGNSGSLAGELIEIEFAPKPENCDVEIDGRYVGGSPVKRRLATGQEYKVRITKAGYQEWTRVIVPEKGLKVTPELQAK